ncbi:hypothetical protein OPT61_g3769 [Boeremia exigua]|uniref:Uncharacterized protein n=1 Tax=Boeremia exigua TaxID=749465 RepID=A0ACC2IGT6_9PLEO|nr:hypothetical protein OPT61_g3769 [Boeremia exigua]
MTSPTGPTTAPAAELLNRSSWTTTLRKRALSTDSTGRTAPDNRSMPESAQLQSWHNAESVFEESNSSQDKSLPTCPRSTTRTPSRTDSLDPCDNEPPEFRLPPLLCPLTESNLQRHTAHTNAESVSTDEMAPSAYSKGSVHFESLQTLSNYGVIIGNGQAMYNVDIIGTFLDDVIRRPRAETPGAKKLHLVAPLAILIGGEAETIILIDNHLMFRDAMHELGGEHHIYKGVEVNFNREYVTHPKDMEKSLAQPRPDRANGYVAYPVQEASMGLLVSPFTEDEHAIVMEDSINERVLFPWLTAQFKSAIGESIEVAKLQCARDGVAVNNYMRQFYERAGMPSDELMTMHWSIACDINIAQLYCHWQDKQGKFHMDLFCSAGLYACDPHQEDRNAQMVFMRKCLRNLLEHVQGARLDSIKTAIRAIQAKRNASSAQSPAKRRKR